MTPYKFSYKRLLLPRTIIACTLFLTIVLLPIIAVTLLLGDRTAAPSNLSSPLASSIASSPLASSIASSPSASSIASSTHFNAEVITEATALPLKNQSQSQKPLQILATTTIAADLVKQIGSTRVSVIALMGAGIDPHLYKARENDVRLLGQAQIIVYHGLHLEAKLSDVLERLSPLKPVINLSHTIPAPSLLRDPKTAIPDPHLWMDVALWSHVATYLAETFIKLDPEYRHHYIENRNRYIQTLTILDNTIRQAVKTIPSSSRVLITAHDAFSYYGKAYALELKALQGISTTSRFNLFDLHTLKAFIIKRGIPAIFAEKSVSKRGLEALAKSLQASGHPITLSDSLYSDALSHPGLPGDTYTKMIWHNTQAIVTALTKKRSTAFSYSIDPASSSLAATHSSSALSTQELFSSGSFSNRIVRTSTF